ncbi:MAG: MFS transporter [Afipia sp.]|nr:MFS transporter [Afipia sp.]
MISAPSRAVAVLCVTQVLGWGALFYPPGLTMPLIAAAHGWSLAQALSGFSIALGVSGLVAPFACGLIERRGGHYVMAAGALLGAAGLLVLALAGNYAVYLAGWVLLGVAMACNLYDPAFTALARIFGTAARRPITLVTFVGGLASTVSWPTAQILIAHGGWRTVYFVFAGVMAFVVAPLYAFVLPRNALYVAPPGTADAAAVSPVRTIPAAGLPFLLVAAGFAAHSVMQSGTLAHLLTILQRGGIDAGTAVVIGALFGPSQVLTRVADFMSGGRLHPLLVARLAMAVMACAFVLLMVLGFSPVIAAVFAVMFGAANGIVTIARGALPLALFGAAGYGRVIGRIARPAQICQALSPFVLAYAMDRWSDRAALEILIVAALFSLGCFLALRRP